MQPKGIFMVVFEEPATGDLATEAHLFVFVSVLK